MSGRGQKRGRHAAPRASHFGARASSPLASGRAGSLVASDAETEAAMEVGDEAADLTSDKNNSGFKNVKRMAEMCKTPG